METPTLADHVCLAIIGEGPTHGWALVRLLAPDGELGRIWSLSRPLTYRSIDRLVEHGLVERADEPRRARLTATRRGRSIRRRWLDAPVDHLRDLRTEFLIKLELRRRAGLPIASVVAAQRVHLAAAIDALTGTEPGDPVAIWRQESAAAALRFLDRVASA